LERGDDAGEGARRLRELSRRLVVLIESHVAVSLPVIAADTFQAPTPFRRIGFAASCGE